MASIDDVAHPVTAQAADAVTDFGLTVAHH